jgi:hypothetical protein
MWIFDLRLMVLENGVVTEPASFDSVSVIGELNPALPLPAILSNWGWDNEQNKLGKY